MATATARWPSRYFTTPLSVAPSTPNAAPTQRRYHYLLAEAPQPLPGSPHILLLHGFPDAFSLATLMGPLSLAGFTCVLPDMLGYGQTSAPDKETRLAEYGPHAMINDLSALMEERQAGKFVVIGHDWGAFLAWKFAIFAPEKVLGVSGICVPYAPSPSQEHFLPFDKLLQVLPNFGYQAFFAEPRSTAIIEANLPPFLRLLFSQPSKLKREFYPQYNFTTVGKMEAFITQPQDPAVLADLEQACLLKGEAWEEALARFSPKSGGSIEGGLNWYRNRRVAWEEERELKSLKLPNLPYLLIMATRDAALPVQMADGMKRHVPAGTLTRETIEGAGHWPVLEQPDRVALVIRQWLAKSVGLGKVSQL